MTTQDKVYELMKNATDWLSVNQVVQLCEGKVEKTAGNAVYTLARKGKLYVRRVEIRDGNGNPRKVNQYKIKPSNLFDPDEFADYYRDPIKGGMSLRTKIHGW